MTCGCPLGITPESFPVDACARTVFGKAKIVLRRRAPEQLHIEVGRLFAGYVDVTLEAGVRQGRPQSSNRYTGIRLRR